MKAWDELQKNFKCCGVGQNSTGDWFDIFGTDAFPASCCRTKDCGGTAMDCPGSTNKDKAQCVRGQVAAENAYSKGCGEKIEDTLEDNLALVAAIGFVLAFVELLGIFSAISIGGNVKKDRTQYA